MAALFVEIRRTPLMLPSFLIIGAQKCGTTSLLQALNAHPLVVPPKVKEPHYFDLRFHENILWYRRRFPVARPWRSNQPLRPVRRRVRGEATPYYLFHPLSAERIAHTLPNVKLVVLLRNPVDRAYSHYQHNVRANREPLTFPDALDAEPQRLAGEAEKIRNRPGYYSYTHQHYSYLTRGEYVTQLNPFTRLFPRENLLVLKAEDFFSATTFWVNEVLHFLELPALPDGSIPITPQHTGSYDKLGGTTRQALEPYFKVHNRHLKERFGIDFAK